MEFCTAAYVAITVHSRYLTPQTARGSVRDPSIFCLIHKQHPIMLAFEELLLIRLCLQSSHPQRGRESRHHPHLSCHHPPSSAYSDKIRPIVVEKQENLAQAG